MELWYTYILYDKRVHKRCSLLVKGKLIKKIFEREFVQAPILKVIYTRRSLPRQQRLLSGQSDC